MLAHGCESLLGKARTLPMNGAGSSRTVHGHVMDTLDDGQVSLHS